VQAVFSPIRKHLIIGSIASVLCISFICLAEYLDRNSDPLDITYGFYTVALLLAAGVFAFISSDKLKLLEKTSQDCPWGLYDHSLRAI